MTFLIVTFHQRYEQIYLKGIADGNNVIDGSLTDLISIPIYIYISQRTHYLILKNAEYNICSFGNQ